MATEFSLESVRQYMLAHEGRVTNHDLVKHYKAWLTHPTEKESARQRFKEYVNTLSTIKNEDGVKFLVLKKRFFPTFADPTPQNVTGGGSSLLDEVMSTYSQQYQPPHHQPRRQLPPTPNAPPPSIPSSAPPSTPLGSSAIPPPYYKAPPPPNYRQPPPPPQPATPSYVPQPAPPSDFGLPMPSDYGLPAPRQGVFHPPGPSSLVGYEIKSNYYQAPPPLPRRNDPQIVSRSSSVMSTASSSHSSQISHSQPHPQFNDQHRSNSRPKLSSESSPDLTKTAQPPTLPTRNNMAKEPSPSVSSSASMSSLASSRKASTSEDKENFDQIVALSGAALLLQVEKAKQEKISVKERTKTFNRMASEGDVTGLVKPGIKDLQIDNKKRKNSSRAGRGTSSHRTESEVDSHDSSSISTLDQAVKQWMVAAAKGDYHTLMKMLRDDPRLSKAKDFTTGYTALHWAAKQGNLDLVKLLAGNYQVNVNVRSYGGYTPLHLACQFGHQEVFDLLVKAYSADANMRDNSGKKPRQYMKSVIGAYGLHNLSNDTFRQLKDRRRNRSRQLADKNSGGILRFGSLSVKVKKTTEAFNNYFNSRDEKKNSNSSSNSGSDNQPYSLPTIGSIDEEKMPPPKFAPIKKRRSKRAADFMHISKTSISAPVSQETSPIKEEDTSRHSDSDGEYGFDSQWSTNRV